MIFQLSWYFGSRLPRGRGGQTARLGTLVAAALSVTACVGTDAAVAPSAGGGAAVARVIMYSDTVTVEMRDKSLCTGPRTRAGKAWSGTLAGCRHLWPYEVTQPAGAMTRLPLQPGAGGAGQVVLSPPGKAQEIWSAPRARASG